MPTRHLVEKRVRNALQTLVLNDDYLIRHNLGERCITHKLAEYLQNVFRSWHVDCEYNKFGDSVKILPLRNDAVLIEDSPVYPDIIIHRRGPPEDPSDPPHCLVIEARKSPATVEKIRRDREKIDRFLDADLRYRYGLLIEFRSRNDEIYYELEWRFAEPQ